MLILVPCGRGNWSHIELRMPGRADLAMINRRMAITMPDGSWREFWVRGVVA